MNFHLFCKMVMFMRLSKGLSATFVKLIQLDDRGNTTDIRFASVCISGELELLAPLFALGFARRKADAFLFPSF